VFLGPEEPQDEDEIVFADDRDQVVDAVIDFGGELVVVIENKVSPADDWQARYLNVIGARVKIGEGQTRVALLWRDLLEILLGLRERELVAGPEAQLIHDFTTYVEDYFPSLGPFRKLSLCRGDHGRIHRRLRQLLCEVSDSEAYPSDHGAYIALDSQIMDRVYLRINDAGDAIDLVAYPADTLTQARAMYPDTALVAAFRELAATDGWEGGPNFHFGYRGPGFCWTYGGIELDPYIDLWRQRIADGDGAVLRDSWNAYWDELVGLGVIDPDSRDEFDQAFAHKNRPSATPRPGLYIARGWDLDDAEALDDRGAFGPEISEALHAITTALRATIVSSIVG